MNASTTAASIEPYEAKNCRHQWDYLDVLTVNGRVTGFEQGADGLKSLSRWKGKKLVDFLTSICGEGWDLYGYYQTGDRNRLAVFYLRKRQALSHPGG
jgi:hypothetical protein